MKILFLDASPTMLAKNLLPIAEAILTKEEDFEGIFIGLNLSSHVDSKIENGSISKINKAGFQYKTVRYWDIEKAITNIKPDLIFIGAYRIFDMLVVAIGKELNISTYKLQHGFEISTVFYKPHIVLSQFKKIIINSIFLFNITKYTDSNYLIVLYQFLNYFFRGKSLKYSVLNNPVFQPQKIFVYSEYYKEFWHEKFGLKKNSMTIITPPDFQLIKKIKNNKRENACCYITQTLVEDGRMSHKNFNKEIIEPYFEIFKKLDKVFIKAHPRGNIKLYRKLLELPNVELTRDFPYCSIYLTHYSSLIYTSLLISDSVYLHELEGHPTPQIFQKVATFVSKDIFALGKNIFSNIENKIPNFQGQINLIKYYSSYSQTNPYEQIANIVITDIRK